MDTINLTEIVRNMGLKPAEKQFADNLDGAAVIETGGGEKLLLKGHLVLICTRGRYSFINSSGTHVCGMDSLCILVKDSSCIFLSASEDCRMAVFETETNALHLASSSLPDLMLFYKHFKESPSFELSEDERDDALSLYNAMRIISGRTGYPFRNEMRQSLDLAMFFLLFAHVRRIDKSSDVMSSRQSRIFQTFLSHVIEHFREHRKLDYYAGLQFISVKHLSSAVRSESGVTAHQWITDYVMIESRELLSRREYSIQEVSDMLHFANQSFFGKFFKAHEGIGPLEYRKKSLAEEKSRFSPG